ncbi:MAG: hypothetical protein V7739_06115 [Motiliproteus sp.]
MATFYTKDNISIRTLEDIVNRPHFEATVLPRKSLFRYVLAAYSLPRKIASCSVSDCYQNHKKGYLVRVDKESECSICEACAKRFMDPSALKPPKVSRSRTGGSSATRTASSTTPALTRDMDLDTFINESTQIKQRVKELKQANQGANWLFQSLSQFQKAYPLELVNALQELQASKDNSSIFERLIENNASDQQLQDVEQLQGLGIFCADIRQLLIENVLKPLTKLDEKAKKAEPEGSIRIAVDWAEQIERNLVMAENLIAEAQLFFCDDNIKRLQSVPLSETAAKKVRSLDWNCDQGAAKTR